MKQFALILIVALFLAVACTPASPQDECLAGLETYMPQMQAIIGRWNDAFEIAESSPRMSLAGPIASLQEIRREANAITPPTCMNELHSSTTQGMDAFVTMFLDFMADPDTEFDDWYLLLAMLSIRAWEEVFADYQEDPTAHVQGLFDRMATVEARNAIEPEQDDGPKGFDVQLTEQARSP